MKNEELIRQLPCWQSDIKIEPLGGGITNHNYVVSSLGADSSRRYVVRLGTDIPVHQIMRFNEIAASKAAEAAGLSPAIRYHAEGVLVMDHIAGVALTPEIVQQQSMLERIVPMIKKCHRTVPNYLRGASVVFWVFHVVRDYAGSLRDAQSKYLDMIPPLVAAATELEAAAGPFDIVFGHNDLLAANILDDGSRLWLIDWEYAGFNTPLFDLGGLASNNNLTQEQERWLLGSYYERDVRDDLWHRYQAMKTASLLRETMWSMISEVHSTLDFDFETYTQDNLARFESSLSDFRSL